MIGGEDPSHLYCDCCCDPPGGHQLLGEGDRGGSPLPWLAADNSSLSISPEGTPPPTATTQLHPAPGPCPDAPPSPTGCPGGGVPFLCDDCENDEDSVYEEVGFQYFPAPPRRLSLLPPPPFGEGVFRRLSLPPVPPPSAAGLLGTSAVIFPDAVFPLESPRPAVHAHCGVGGVLRSLGVCGRPSSMATEVETVSTYTMDNDARDHQPHHIYAASTTTANKGGKTLKARGAKVSHPPCFPPPSFPPTVCH